MTEKLKNPDLPAGEIVEKREDGVWVRNDGVELQPAEKNPYYVLATVYGEQDGDLIRQELAEKNRRIWNGWACRNLDALERARIAEIIGLAEDQLAPLTEREKALLDGALADRIGLGRKYIDQNKVSFGRLYFRNSMDFAGFFFPQATTFLSVHFSKSADFARSYFAGPTHFENVHAAGWIVFDNAQFDNFFEFHRSFAARTSKFTASRFAGYADFSLSWFSGFTHFSGAIFEKTADFRETVFQGNVDFSNGSFEAITDFSDAEFVKRVPDFFQRAFHDNTIFTAKSGNWPQVDPSVASTSKNVYRRLRQVSADQHNPDNEHFFLRQEMACSAVLSENDWLSRLVIKAYGFFSSYGFSIARPLTGLASTWIGGALAMQIEFARRMVFRIPFEGTDHIPAFGEAIWLGLANTFAIFGFRTFYFGEAYMTALPALVKIVGGTQTVLGFISLFFLGLGLRNRFRLK